MKYTFVLPVSGGDGREYRDVTFEAEVPGERDMGDGGETAQGFVDRALRTARYVIKKLEEKA